MKCKNCLYYSEYRDPKLTPEEQACMETCYGYGTCHRYPPVVAQGAIPAIIARIEWEEGEPRATVDDEPMPVPMILEACLEARTWPGTTEHGWCGEFRDRSLYQCVLHPETRRDPPSTAKTTTSTPTSKPT